MHPGDHMVANWLEWRSRFLFCYLKTKPTMAHKAKRNSWEVTWAALTRSPRASFSLSLSLSFFSFSRRLWPSRIGDEIEIVTYSRVPFIHTSTSCHRGAQLHRCPIVPQSRFVTVTYTIRRYRDRWRRMMGDRRYCFRYCSPEWAARSRTGPCVFITSRSGKVLSNTLPVGTART